MKKGDGGPAFPRLKRLADRSQGGRFYGAEYHSGGMSLRDYFAGQAMMGLIASDDEGAGDRLADIPGYAYAIADAMLAERGNDDG